MQTIIPDGLFFQFFYTGRVGVWLGRFEVTEFNHWAGVMLEYYSSLYPDVDWEEIDFYIGSQLATPLFTSDGWQFRFFSRREFSRSVSDFAVYILGDGTTKASFNSKHNQAGQLIEKYCLDWFSVYFGYLYHLDADLLCSTFRSFDGNLYRCFADGDLFGTGLSWSVVRYGLDAVDFRSLVFCN